MNETGLRYKKYLHTSRKRFDPISLVVSLGIFAGVFWSIAHGQKAGDLWDERSFLIVAGGTLASLLFQFDVSSFLTTLMYIVRSFWGTPERRLLDVIKELDLAIMERSPFDQLREGSEISGELLNDIVYMHKKGLLFEEIDEFVTSRIRDQFMGRQVAVDLLDRAAVISPALGLFGTVMGLIGVLQSLSDPAHIGPSMSLALMTTAFGAGLGSLVFTPLSGRIRHHNEIFLHVHKQILSKVGILLLRQEQQTDDASDEDAA